MRCSELSVRQRWNPVALLAVLAWLLALFRVFTSDVLCLQVAALHTWAMGQERTRLVVRVHSQQPQVLALVAQVKLDEQVLLRKESRPGQTDLLEIEMPMIPKGNLELKLAGLDNTRCFVTSAAQAIELTGESTLRMELDLHKLREPVCD